MTIVQLVNPAPFGGLESVVTHLLVGLHGSGASTLALVLMDEGSEPPRLLADLARAGVPFETLHVPPRSYLRERSLIANGLARCGARVVHSHGARMDVMARLATSRSRVRWLSTLHGFTGGDRKNRFYEWLQLRALRAADRVLGVSQAIVTRAVGSGIAERKVRLVRNAVPPLDALQRSEAQRELGLGDGRRWVGWVGRLADAKDPALFAEAIRSAADPSVCGVVVGDGPLLGLIEGQFHDLIAAGRLVLAGPRLQAGRLMRAFDALVVSSVTEGTPMVVLEAMQSGVPVVATAVGGLPDVLEGGAGVLVTERSGNALGQAILQVVNDRSAAAALARAGEQRITSHFSTPAWLAAHIQLYSELSAMHANAS